jgi:hypothetical protein
MENRKANIAEQDRLEHLERLHVAPEPAFDPEKVERIDNAEVEHVGWHETRGQCDWVRASDYYQLLALYRDKVLTLAAADQALRTGLSK